MTKSKAHKRGRRNRGGSGMTMPRVVEIAPWNSLTVRFDGSVVTLGAIRTALSNQLSNNPSSVLLSIDLRLKAVSFFLDTVTPTGTSPVFTFMKVFLMDLTGLSDLLSTSRAIVLKGRDQDLSRQPMTRLMWPKWQHQIVFVPTDLPGNIVASTDSANCRSLIELQWRPHFIPA